MKKTILIALLIGLGLAATAQEFTFYGEGVIPTGRYGKSMITNFDGGYRPVSAITDTANSLGGASYGWGAGFQFAFPMANNGIDLVFDAGFRMNWVDGKIQGYFDDYAAHNGTEGITSAPHYYNIPLMVGPRFTAKVAEGLNFYLGLMAGFDIRIISDAIYAPDLFYDYYSAGVLGLRASAGVLFYDHIRIEVNWSWLGNNAVEATLYDGIYHNRGALGNMETMQFGARVGWTF